MRNLNVELYVIERAAVLFPGEVIMWDFRADTIFNTPVFISTSRSSTMEEIEREHIMQVQAESRRSRMLRKVFGINATTRGEREPYKFDTLALSDAGSPR